MGYYVHQAMLCKKCKMKSDIIKVKNGSYIERTNPFNIFGFIGLHIGCGDLVIEEISSEHNHFEILPGDKYFEYVEDLGGPYRLEEEDVIADLQAYNDMINVSKYVGNKLFERDKFGFYVGYCRIAVNDYMRNKDNEKELFGNDVQNKNMDWVRTCSAKVNDYVNKLEDKQNEK